MICRILEKKQGVYFVQTETGIYAYLFHAEKIDLHIGDFVETGVLSFDDIYADVYVVFKRKLSVPDDFYLQKQNLRFLPCESCDNRMKKILNACTFCNPKKEKGPN